MSDRTLARIAGVFYLAVAVLGGFSEYVRTSTDAVNIGQRLTLLHVALVTDLVDSVCFLAVGLILYALLRAVNPAIAVAMLTLNAVSVAMQALNMLNHAGALLAATDPRFTSGLTVAAFLELHRVGYLIAQIFFGGYLLPLGYLVYRSSLFPRVLGVVLMLGCAGYLLGVAVSFASPTLDSSLATPFGLAGGLAELGFLVWLIVMGERSQTSIEPKGAMQWSA